MNSGKSDIEIHRVESKRDLVEFVKFPWEIYRGDEHWVPPIIKEQVKFLGPSNPYFEHAEAEHFLALRSGKICGRISASVDHRYNEFHNEKVGIFGFFESVNDAEVAARLLDTARDWLREKGMEMMRGPACYTTNHEGFGLLIDGFDTDPMLFAAHNPQYYMELIEGYGLKKARDVYSYMMNYYEVDFSYVRELADKAAENHVTARKINLKDLKGEMERVKEVYNTAWSKNWGFVPLTDAEIEDIAHHLKDLVVEDLSFIGELDGKPIGYLLLLPDYNIPVKKFNGKLGPVQMLQFMWAKNRIKRGRLFMLGVKHHYQKTGVAAAMVVMGYDNAIRRGYTACEFSWILEDNTAVRTLCEMFGGKIYKTHRIYEVSLSNK